jgi:acetyl-CoA C-acetyltransferase
MQQVRVAVLGGAAVPVGKLQTPDSAEIQVVEHEVLGRLVLGAVRDAGIDKSDVQAMVFSLCRPYTRQKYFSTFMANYLRLPSPGVIIEVLGNGMTGGYAFDRAADEIRMGRARTALALGVNFETATSAAEHANSSMRATGDVDFHAPFGFTPISWYAMDAARYIHEHHSSREEIASVAVKNRHHATLNPLAQFRKPLTLEGVLDQPQIVEPLGLYEVPPRGDGAVCLVLASEDVAKATGRPYALLRGRGYFHEGAHQISDIPNDMIDFRAARAAGEQAFADAGVKPEDIDLAELYAPCTIVEVLVSEALGLTPLGGGAKAAKAGETTLGGRIPICTSGGLQSRGHPSYITPLYSVVEILEQLRGRSGARQVSDARLAISSCELGNYNAALVHIFESVQ